MNTTPEQVEANTLWGTLGLLDEQARRARQRVEGLEVEQHKAAGAIERATGPLRDYYEAVSAGERAPDHELEDQLRATAREAQDRLSMRSTQPAAGVAAMYMVDDRVEAELAGARRALEQAERQLDQFLSREMDGLAAELWPSTVAARDAFDARWAALRGAERDWLDVLRLWERLRPVAGVPVEEVPASPLRGVSRAIEDGVPLPMPPSLTPEEARSGA